MHNRLIQTCWLTAKSSVSVCAYARVFVCVCVCVCVCVRILLHHVCLPAFIKYVITHIRAQLINKHKRCFLSSSQLFFFFFLLLSRATESREGENFTALQNLQPGRTWRGEAGRRAGRIESDEKKAGEVMDVNSEGEERKARRPAPLPCSRDGWNTGRGRGSTRGGGWMMWGGLGIA